MFLAVATAECLTGNWLYVTVDGRGFTAAARVDASSLCLGPQKMTAYRTGRNGSIDGCSQRHNDTTRHSTRKLG
jgi:hypothetical protein